jgi:hypothetical protein
VQGDITSLRELLMKMTNKNITVDKFTVEAMADGLLNVGDISGASSVVQVRTRNNSALVHANILTFCLLLLLLLLHRTFSTSMIRFLREYYCSKYYFGFQLDTTH